MCKFVFFDFLPHICPAPYVIIITPTDLLSSACDFKRKAMNKLKIETHQDTHIMQA